MEETNIPPGWEEGFVIGPYICKICGKPSEGFTDHEDCIRCPECGEADLIIYNNKKLIFRCLNCLNRYEKIRVN